MYLCCNFKWLIDHCELYLVMSKISKSMSRTCILYLQFPSSSVEHYLRFKILFVALLKPVFSHERVDRTVYCCIAIIMKRCKLKKMNLTDGTKKIVIVLVGEVFNKKDSSSSLCHKCLSYIISRLLNTILLISMILQLVMNVHTFCSVHYINNMIFSMYPAG